MEQPGNPVPRQSPTHRLDGERRPCIVAVMGLPGAGKSTVARAIEWQLGMRRVCRDAIRAAMFPRCDHSYVEKRAAFRSVLLALEINCALDASSVVDGMTFSRRDDYERVAALAAEHGADVLPLLIECTPALARERVAKGSAEHPAGDRQPALVDEVAARFEAPPEYAVRIDARLPAEDMCRLAVAAVVAHLRIDPPVA
ncbi:MAG: AAA family ATPase [Dokdonella sp.]